MIEIALYGPFREAVGEKTVEFGVDDETTVGSVLRSLAAEYPDLDARLFEDGHLRESINVSKNGKNVKLLDRGETPIDDGDRLTVTVSLEGG